MVSCALLPAASIGTSKTSRSTAMPQPASRLVASPTSQAPWASSYSFSACGGNNAFHSLQVGGGDPRALDGPGQPNPVDIPGHEPALPVPTGHDPQIDQTTEELQGRPTPLDSSASVIDGSLMGE
jgi:hypothetical protein